MDIQTQYPAKPSSYANAVTPLPSWFNANRATVVRLSVLLAALVLIAVAASIYVNNQSAKAADAFSAAMDVYDAPLQQPGQPAQPDSPSFATAADRAKAAYPLFSNVADKFGMYKAGANARYFAGLTAQTLGQNAQAEADLKKAADSSDKGLASLAKLALASLYRQTNRLDQAVALYQQLIASPTATVSASAARLNLAESYEATRPDEARRLYAQIKDTDKTTAAGQLAAQKLDGKKQ